jgi:hypothetical protein
MKKTIIVLFLLGAVMPVVHAQQKTVHHLILTIFESYGLGGSKTLIETRDDGTQTRRKIGMRQPTGLNNVMKNEDTVMLALKPYFAAGWEISASTTTESSTDVFTRIFLRKEE